MYFIGLCVIVHTMKRIISVQCVLVPILFGNIYSRMQSTEEEEEEEERYETKGLSE